MDPDITRPSLLLRIRDSHDADAWGQFIEIYSPLVHRFAIKRGLQEADSADLTQDVMRTVARSIGKLDYDPKIGRFRGWLFKVAHSKLINLVNRRKREPVGSGDTQIGEIISSQASTQNDEELWNREYEQHLFQWAAEQVKGQFKASTWEAFWLSAVENKSVKETAEKVGISEGAVYIAKSRVLARLKEKIQEVGDDE